MTKTIIFEASNNATLTMIVDQWLKDNNVKLVSVRPKSTALAITYIPLDSYIPAENITDALLSLGFSPRLCGYRYLRTAIPMILNDYSLLSNVTKRLYKLVADKHMTTVKKVENGIYHAIFNAWETGKLGKLHRWVDTPPTNCEFLALFCEKVKLLQNAS